jgi:hypothetical protein
MILSKFAMRKCNRCGDVELRFRAIEREKHVPRFLSSIVAAIAFCAWLGVANHCAFTALTTIQPTQSGDANECPMHSTPAKQKPKSLVAPCCKILRATLAKNATNLARAVVDLAHVDLSFAGYVRFAPPKPFFGASTLDTGPPGETALAYLISSSPLRAPPARA